MEEMNKMNEQFGLQAVERQYVTDEKSDDGNYTLSFNNAKVSYSSFQPETFSEKIRFFRAVNNPDKSVKDCINMTINLQHVFAEQVDFIDKKGAVTPGFRIVLIDTDGNSYKCASKGIFSSISKLFNICGQPDTWEHPVPIVIRMINKANDRSVLVFDIDMETMEEMEG